MRARDLAWPLAMLVTLPVHGAGFAFALIGDLPYNRFERTWFPDYLRQVAADGVDLVIHVGDFKSGAEPCSDALYAERRTLFDASPVPFVLVPGDNDWSDCNRLATGRFDPLERLEALRRLFYPPGRSLGRRTIEVHSQADDTPPSPYRENLRWRSGDVVFLTLNVPGPGNRRGHGDPPPAEFTARNAANLAWLESGFALARESGAGAVVVALQADMAWEDFADGAPRAGYAQLQQRIRALTLEFDGDVLLAHGDGHRLQIDHPLRDPGGRTIRRFTRVETYGSPLMGWVRVDVQPAGAPRFEPRARAYTPRIAGQRILP